MNKNLIGYLIVLIFLFLGCKKGGNSAHSPNELGALVYLLTGSVQASSKEGKEIQIEPKTTMLFSGDTLETGVGGKADLLLHDGTFIRVYEKTKLTISNVLNQAGGRTESKIKIVSGKLFVHSAKQLKNRDIQVITPTAVAGIRGTEFTVEETGSNTIVKVGVGSVETMLPDSETGEIVEAGMKAEVEDAIQITSMTPEEIKEFQNESQTVNFIVQNGKSEIQAILQKFESEKQTILDTIEKKKEENQELLNNKLNENKELLNSQKSAGKEKIDSIKTSTQEEKAKLDSNFQNNKDQIQEGTKSEMERIKSGMQ